MEGLIHAFVSMSVVNNCKKGEQGLKELNFADAIRERSLRKDVAPTLVFKNHRLVTTLSQRCSS